MREFVDQLVPIVAVAVMLMLFVDAVLTVIKLIRGPSVLNRALASDLLVSTIVCAVGAEMVLSRHSWSLPLLISLALLSFVGTVAVSRFVARDRDEDSAAAAAERRRRGEYARRGYAEMVTDQIESPPGRGKS